MRLDQIATATLGHLLGRLLWRALIAAAMAVVAVVAIYQFSVAGTLELAERYGPVHAHLIVGAIYAVLAFACLIGLWAMRARTTETSTPTLAQGREMQIAMLIEAVMLGYTLARKSGRA
jgi:heme/copper-type cytochrome/quinol oxidase subunit 2